ncbi:hypothetical protein EYF80_048547 [Liparis tanakae]|uniref:Uncharacterized protein n=1 Tax=Liparis tanakae TaxID=230148 RepID=A0A4Z2FLY9_9TELE|nr:hypothetical protein EYF80_048547 [Liparis tanakae]
MIDRAAAWAAAPLRQQREAQQPVDFGSDALRLRNGPGRSKSTHTGRRTASLETTSQQKSRNPKRRGGSEELEMLGGREGRLTSIHVLQTCLKTKAAFPLMHY